MDLLVFKVYAALFLWDRFVAPLAPHPVTEPQVLALAGQLGLLALVSVIALCFRAEADGPPAP